jgi:hypothetical protein
MKAMTMAILSKNGGGQVKKGGKLTWTSANFPALFGSTFRSTPTVSQKLEMVLISRSGGAAG